MTDSVAIFNGLLKKFKMNTYEDSKADPKIVNALHAIVMTIIERSGDVLEDVHKMDEDSFPHILNGLFDSHISWGRIFMSFALTITMLEKVYFSPDTFNRKYNLFTCFLKNRLENWIIENGAWVNM